MDRHRTFWCLAAALAWLISSAGCSLPDLGEPEIDVSPLSIDFGTMEMGTEHSASVTIGNRGELDLVIAALEIVDSDRFAVTSTEVPITLESDEETDVTITFAVLDGLAHSGELHISSNDPDDEVVSVDLAAIGLGPALQITPNQWDFGEVGVYCDTSVELVLESVGTESLTIETWIFQSSPSETAMNWATQDLYEDLILPPGETAHMTMGFRAEDLGSYEGALTVEVEDIPSVSATLYGSGVGGDWVTDLFEQEGTNETDILWVVDDSCSMSEEQGQLADDFADFLSIIDAYGVDYHIAVVTTGEHTFVGNIPVIDTTTDNAAQLFAANCQVGTDGTNTETGLLTGLEALALARSNSPPNDGFYRESAGLRVIFVSDEPDQSGDWKPLVESYLDLKPESGAVVLSAICGTDGLIAQTCNGPGGNADAGTGYVDAALATGGVLTSICDSDWSQALANIGWLSMSLTNILSLSEHPIPSTISVVANGEPLLDGWSYDPGQNAVVLESEVAPEEGDELEVAYQMPGECGGA